jgi:hypothetical protein
VKCSLASVGWLAAYAVVLTLIVGGASYMRTVAIAVYGTPQAQTEWDTWREDVKELEKQPYPVKRRVPKSTEPPALVLMRDYFGVCLTVAVVLSTVLFGTFMVLVKGAMNDSRRAGPGSESGRRPTA